MTSKAPHVLISPIDFSSPTKFFLSEAILCKGFGSSLFVTDGMAIRLLLLPPAPASANSSRAVVTEHVSVRSQLYEQPAFSGVSLQNPIVSLHSNIFSDIGFLHAITLTGDVYVVSIDNKNAYMSEYCLSANSGIGQCHVDSCTCPSGGGVLTCVSRLDMCRVDIYVGQRSVASFSTDGDIPVCSFVNSDMTVTVVCRRSLLRHKVFLDGNKKVACMLNRPLSLGGAQILCANKTFDMLTLGLDSRQVVTTDLNGNQLSCWTRGCKHEPLYLFGTLSGQDVIVCALSNEVLSGDRANGIEGSRYDYGFRSDSLWLGLDYFPENDVLVGATERHLYICHHAGQLGRVASEKGEEYYKKQTTAENAS